MKSKSCRPCKRPSSQEVAVEGLAVEVVVVVVVAASVEVVAEGFLAGEAVAVGLTRDIKSVAS